MRGTWLLVLAMAATSAPAHGQSAGSLESGEAWRRFAARIGATGDVVLQEAAPSSPRDRAEGYRYLARLVATSVDRYVDRADPDAPRVRWSASTWGLPNADAVFTTLPLRGDAVYRLSGRRGSVHWLNFQVTGGWFDSDQPMRVVSQLSADDLSLDADGGFELILGGPERPGNWLPLARDASMLTIRQFFYDWQRETRAEVQIERIGDVAPAARPDPERLARQLDAAAGFVETTARLFVERSLAARAGATNRFREPFRAGDQLGIQDSIYTSGHFVLGPDQALLVEVRPPRCHYWGFQLGNFWMEPLDFATRQTSLNGHQARLDADGVFRAVVSHRDPGVPNWLDASGNSEGAMLIRWIQCDGGPRPETRLVDVDQVREALPPETPRVTPEQRAATLALRRAHVAGRYR